MRRVFALTAGELVGGGGIVRFCVCLWVCVAGGLQGGCVRRGGARCQKGQKTP